MRWPLHVRCRRKKFTLAISSPDEFLLVFSNVICCSLYYIMLTLFRCNLHCKRPVRPYASHYRQNLANTTEPSVCGGDAALCKITLTTCCSGLHSSVASLQTHLDGQTAYIPGPAGGRFMSDRI